MDTVLFSITVYPALVFLIYEFAKVRNIAKHDRHLYRFCAIRRDVIQLITENHEDLSRTDYIAARKLLKVLNMTINSYQSHKTIIFDFRLLEKYYQEHKKVQHEKDVITTKNKAIKSLLVETHNAIIKSFLAYTPFLKHELAAKAVFKYFRTVSGNRYEEVIQGLSSIANQKAHYNA